MCISDWSSDVCSSDLPQKIKRHRLRRSRSRMPREEFNARGGDEAAELARLGAAATGLPPSTAQSVQLLIDGAAKYASLLEAIAPARDHLHVEYYICHPDRPGNALLEALVHLARSGGKVRLVPPPVRAPDANRSFCRP